MFQVRYKVILNWNEHINNIVKKASKRLYFLSRLKRAKVPLNDSVKFYMANFTIFQSVSLQTSQVFEHYAGTNPKSRFKHYIYGYDVSYAEALLGLSELHAQTYHRNSKDMFHGLLLYNYIKVLSLRNRRKFTIPIKRTV